MNDHLLTNCRLISMTVDGSSEPQPGMSIAFRQGIIEWIGADGDHPADFSALPTSDAGGRLTVPGLVDPHALICAISDDDRPCSSHGFAQTVVRWTTATAAANDDAICTAVLSAAELMLRAGVTSADLRTGFGLDAASQRRLIELAGKIAAKAPISLVRTIVPALVRQPDGDSSDLLDQIERELLPGVMDDGLADMVEVFCDDEVAFDLDDCSTILEIAYKRKLPSRVACDRYCDSAGATLPPSFYSHAAVYLNHSDEVSLDTIGAGKTVAVLAPFAIEAGAEQLPDVSAIRSAGIPIALTADAFPQAGGTTLQAAARAREMFGLSDAEAFAGVTSIAARAIGRSDRAGSLTVGRSADIALFDATDLAALLDAPAPPTGLIAGGIWRI